MTAKISIAHTATFINKFDACASAKDGQIWFPFSVDLPAHFLKCRRLITRSQFPLPSLYNSLQFLTFLLLVLW